MRHRLVKLQAGLLLFGGLASCSNPPASSRPAPEPLSQQLPDGKRWTLTNLSVETQDSYCYDNEPSSCRRYGRLYTWDAARKACASLGSGWHLPSMQDWRQVANVYGGVFGAGADSGKAAFRELLVGGRSGLNMLLGGMREDRTDAYSRLEAHGIYWSTTEASPTTAHVLNFAKGSLTLYAQDGGAKTRAFSVRCVANGPSS